MTRELIETIKDAGLDTKLLNIRKEYIVHMKNKGVDSEKIMDRINLVDIDHLERIYEVCK